MSLNTGVYLENNNDAQRFIFIFFLENIYISIQKILLQIEIKNNLLDL